MSSRQPRPRDHLRTRINPNIARADPPAMYNGTFGNRSLAITDSTIPMAAGTTTKLARRTPSPDQTFVREPGTNTLTMMTENTASLSELEYRINAKSGPLWSRTITSWIIVSSRCVVGSSTGMREHSARASANRLKPTMTYDGPAATKPGLGCDAPSIAVSENS